MRMMTKEQKKNKGAHASNRKRGESVVRQGRSTLEVNSEQWRGEYGFKSENNNVVES